MKFIPWKVICMIEAMMLVNRLFLCSLRTANSKSNSQVFIPILLTWNWLFTSLLFLSSPEECSRCYVVHSKGGVHICIKRLSISISLVFSSHESPYSPLHPNRQIDHPGLHWPSRGGPSPHVGDHPQRPPLEPLMQVHIVHWSRWHDQSIQHNMYTALHSHSLVSVSM